MCVAKRDEVTVCRADNARGSSDHIFPLLFSSLKNHFDTYCYEILCKKNIKNDKRQTDNEHFG